ncbi:MAG: hypothetical protein JSR39_08010 [Verrucomicrobia bacterium]|nr:hypothetical protein [Verrucomicrobiota bacterium]
MSPNHHFSQVNPRSSRLKWLLAILVLTSVFLFRKSLILLGVKIALSSAIPKSPDVQWGYEQMVWKEEQLCIVGFHCCQRQKQITIDLAQVQLHFDWRHAKILAQIELEHPHLILENGSAQESGGIPFPALFSHPRLEMRWEMEHGVLQFPSSLPVSRLFFSFHSGPLVEQLGTFTLAYEPGADALPLLTVDLAAQGDKLGYRFQMHEIDCGRIIPLLPFLSSAPSLHWKDAHGQVAMDGHGEIDSHGEITEFFCQVKGENISLTHLIGGRQLALAELEADITYSPTLGKKAFWEEISAHIHAQDGKWMMTDEEKKPWISLEQINLNCTLAPDTDPEFGIDGMIVQGEQKGPVQIAGKGGIQPDGKYWLETQIALGSDKERLDAILSLCQPEEDLHILHIELQRADARHLDWIAQMSMPAGLTKICSQGSVQGKIVLEFFKDSCRRFQLDEVAAQNLRLEFPLAKTTVSAGMAKLDAEISKSENGQWLIERGALDLLGGQGMFGNQEGQSSRPAHLCQLEGNLLIEANELKPSMLHAQIGKISGNIVVHGTDAEHLLDAEWQGDINDFYALAFPGVKNSASPCRLKGSLIKNQTGWDWIGECAVGDEAVQWGFEAQGPTSLAQLIDKGCSWTVSEGWLRSEKLTESTYGPMAKALLGDLQLKGAIDLFGTFKGSQWNWSLQGSGLRLDHPWFALILPQLGEKDPQLLLTEGRALFSYDVKTHSLIGDLPVQEGMFVHKNLNLSFEHLKGNIQIKDGVVQADQLNTVCHGLQIEGAVSVRLLGAEDFDLVLETKSIEGDLSSLQAVAGHFPQLKLSALGDLEGKFISGQGGLALASEVRGDQARTQWAFGGQFSDLHIPFSEQSYLSNASCMLHYDAYLKEMVVNNGRGTWVLADGSAYQVQIDNFKFNPERSALFDIKILDAKKEIGRFNGQLELNPSSGWDLQFDRSSTHFYGTQLQMGKVVFSRDGKLLFFEMRPIIKIEDLQKQLKFIMSSGLFASAEFDANELDAWQLAGEVKTDMKFEGKVFNFRAQGSDLHFKGKRIDQFNLIGKRENDRWIIEQLHADGLNTKAVLDVRDKKVSFSQIEGSWDQLFWKGSAAYLSDQKNFTIALDSFQGNLQALAAIDPKLKPAVQGAFACSARAEWQLGSATIDGECTAVVDMKPPFNILMKQETPLRFSYTDGQGLHLKGIEPKLYVKGSMQYLGTVRANAVIQKDQYDLSEIQFSLSPESVQRAIDAKVISSDFKQFYYESFLEGRGDLHSSANQVLFKGSLRDGRYGIKDQIFSLQNIGIIYENALLQCHFKTALNEQPLWGSLHVDLKGAPVGSVHICDHIKPEGIQAEFRSNGTALFWESILGSACGIDVQLKKATSSQMPNATVLTGNVNIDGSRLDAFFPKEMKEKFKNLKLGKGYEFKGDLVLWNDSKKGFQLNGQLLGHRFELLGYQFDRLRAVIEANPQSIQISKLGIDDEAGLFQIKKIAIDHNASNEKWSFYIPLLQIKDLQPSLMKKIDSRDATVKPLVIRNLSLSEIRGDLNDPRGWAGEGHLNFTNAFKKESTLFETPIEMIKNFGIDPGLLTPIQGEIDIELRGDKFYLVNMKNSFSDGKRAQFFLSPADQTAFIDLNGNIHIDICMRQDVVLKLTEALTLTVRGTLDKPRYGLKY